MTLLLTENTMLSTLKVLVRLFKGNWMGWMFSLFFVGIVFEALVVVPVIGLIERYKGRDPDRMQAFNRRMFSVWLLLLSIGGLLRGKRPKGKCYDGPCVVVANHPGLFDVLFLIRDIPRMSVLVKVDLSRQLPLGGVFRASGYVLSPDFVTISPLESLLGAIEMIKSGHKFMLFPEGTRSPEGGLRPFHAGAFKMARKTKVPIQPVLIKNDPAFISTGWKWHYPAWEVSRVEIEYWDPIPPPARGQERRMAGELEERYRRALGLPPGRAADMADEAGPVKAADNLRG